MKINRKYIALFVLLMPLLTFSQEVSNIHFEQVGKQIHIFYDLQGNGKYNVTVYCSPDKGQYYGKPLQKVTGAVGERQAAGTNKKIVWDVLAEREKLTGEISFKIEAIAVIITGTFIDSRDRQTYKWVKIGDQVWMAENLNYKASNSWWYDNSAANGDVYGRLYTGKAALAACPASWHLPTNSEWTALVEYLGGKRKASGKMKETGTSSWLSPNSGATNSSGFNALPGGYRDTSGNFYGLGYRGSWWSATANGPTDAWYRNLYYNTDEVIRYSGRDSGFSVRCVRD